MRIHKFFILVFGLFISYEALAASFNLDTLSQSLQTTKNKTVYYTQYRYLNFSDNPVVTRGVLAYIPPDTFTQTINTQTQVVALSGSQGTIIDNNGNQRTFDLTDYPLLSSPLIVLRAMMQGDTTLLKQQYHTTLKGTFSSWQLILKPKDAVLAKQLDSIVLEGHGNAIYRVRLTETHGNVTVLMLSSKAG